MTLLGAGVSGLALVLGAAALVSDFLAEMTTWKVGFFFSGLAGVPFPFAGVLVFAGVPLVGVLLEGVALFEGVVEEEEDAALLEGVVDEAAGLERPRFLLAVVFLLCFEDACAFSLLVARTAAWAGFFSDCLPPGALAAAALLGAALFFLITSSSPADSRASKSRLGTGVLGIFALFFFFFLDWFFSLTPGVVFFESLCNGCAVINYRRKWISISINYDLAGLNPNVTRKNSRTAFFVSGLSKPVRESKCLLSLTHHKWILRVLGRCGHARPLLQARPRHRPPSALRWQEGAAANKGARRWL